MVSPANSLGIMDGGYDLELSLAFGTDKWDLTNHCQSHLRSLWHGYAPPGTCTIIPIPESMTNQWNATSLAVIPTMRVPENVAWHRDLVYNSMWSLLVSIGHWNSSADDQANSELADNPKRPISSVLIPGLGTGVGNIGAERCARQMILAVKHFFQGQELPVNPRWDDVQDRAEEIERTTEL
ncbi:hypothetical protein C8J56DRAFT_1000123 [Mycena floridula]|nr:hypothetical protein C8J56DRAFT_1000123 [Mycena floridula]